MRELDKVSTWEEFMNSVAKLTNEKSQGINRFPRTTSRKFLKRIFFTTSTLSLGFGKIDRTFLVCHEGQVISVRNSWELSDPKKWRGLNSMDITKTFFRSMMCKILFKIINLHVLKYQFLSSSGVGCQYGLFTLKIGIASHDLGV